MSVPKQRHTKGRRDRRRANIRLAVKKLITCSHCKKMTRQHFVCPYCGYYRGRKVKDVAAKKSKKKSAKK